ncbi:MAG: hypothetical protein KKI09_03475 [Spirochaetes bacterium]|nr:hypothetical protein [Spirochaetota bacterium]MBU0954467.1 hypothetical protein [Spirochaetota bacterium]
MSFRAKTNRQKDFSRGLDALARHDPATALVHLRSAVAACSAAHPGELSRRLYWLAITLHRLGKQPLAIKALSSARQLAPRGHISRYFSHTTNEYGQPRCSCAEHDDYRAFFSVQVQRYLWSVPGQRFTDNVEMETVMAIIAKAWLQMQKSGALAELDCRQKVAYFNRYRIQFPVLRAENRNTSRISSFAVGFSVELDGKSGRLPMPVEKLSII